MTATELHDLLLVTFPDLTEKMFLEILNQSMRIVAEDTQEFINQESITTDGASYYDLDDELTYEPHKLKLVQLNDATIEAVQANMLEALDI